MSSGTRWSLIDGALDGDPVSQREFVARYRPVVVRTAGRAGLGDEAEDVAQEVFVRLFGGALDQAAPDRGSFRAYLFVITKRAVADFLERKHAVKRGGRDQVQALGEHDPALAGSADDFDREWFLHLLELAMERLRAEHPNYFEAVQAFLLEERAQPEIAAALGRSLQDVRNHVHRGRKKLIGYLREEVARYATTPQRHQTELEVMGRWLGEA